MGGTRHSSLLGIELLNEPGWAVEWNHGLLLRDYYTRALAVVRAFSSQALVVFNVLYSGTDSSISNPTPCYCRPVDSAFVPLTSSQTHAQTTSLRASVIGGMVSSSRRMSSSTFTCMTATTTHPKGPQQST